MPGTKLRIVRALSRDNNNYNYKKEAKAAAALFTQRKQPVGPGLAWLSPGNCSVNFPRNHNKNNKTKKYYLYYTKMSSENKKNKKTKSRVAKKSN